MRIEVELLGIINPDTTAKSALQRKFILKVTAEQLAQWLQFDRRGRAKNSPFKILEYSLIKIDDDVQRGLDVDGYLMQTAAKVMDIATTLLDPSNQLVPHLYLGTLLWNIRPKRNQNFEKDFEIQKVEVVGKPPVYRLAFDTDAIYLTDSAHRHLGIVEAYRRYAESPSTYRSFNPRMEFAVELYTLEKDLEKEMFAELNSKQKKISPSKKKQMDVSSPIGRLKDEIIKHDGLAEQLFYENIEKTSSQNDKHTLLTMSVFFHTISEMFTGAEIKEARNDDDLRRQLAQYYCEFFYELSMILVVRINTDSGPTDVHPYRNLHLELIKPALERYDHERPQLSDEQLQKAIEEATRQNLLLRRIDVANSNSFVRAFARLGGYIRRMDGWRNVLTRLQMQVNLPMQGQLFQEANVELFQTDPTLGTYIASKNEDGTINVQVQTKTINACFEYLMRKVDVRRNPMVVYGNATTENPSPLLEDSPRAQYVPTEESTYCYLTLQFHLPSSVTEWDDSSPVLEVDGGDGWPTVTKKAKARIHHCACEQDLSYVDEHYSDICLWRATFEVNWPPAASMKRRECSVRLRFFFPSFDNPKQTTTTIRSLTLVKLEGSSE